MALPTLSLSTSLTIRLHPLDPESFAPFGTCITSPLPRTLNAVPSIIPTPLYPNRQPSPISANQNTALKTSPISPLLNNYPSTSDKPQTKPLMSMFSCFPRPATDTKSGKLTVKILERHPFTTQTFSPLGFSPDSADTVFLVIVASSLPGGKSGVRNPPDLSHIKAFVARGDQAVTYGVGTWHAPMVVLGEARVDFMVAQFVNGVPDDDCQEVLVEGVAVDLTGLSIPKASKAKL